MFNLQKDIEKAVRKYPSLQFIEGQGLPIVKGLFTAHDKRRKVEIESYEILITFSKSYPYAFPLVEEISKKIPRELDRHVKSDGTLCFANPQEELGICASGITFLWFLEEILNTHLCREYVREKTNKYPTGERSHGVEGIWEGYYELFNTIDKYTILKELNLILNHGFVGRNTLCYCGSGKKYKRCHEKIEALVTRIGKGKAIQIFELLKRNYETNETVQ